MRPITIAEQQTLSYILRSLNLPPTVSELDDYGWELVMLALQDHDTHGDIIAFKLTTLRREGKI